MNESGLGDDPLTQAAQPSEETHIEPQIDKEHRALRTPRNSFDFPTLNNDGSVPDLTLLEPTARLNHQTPPAALSSLAAKMAMNDSVTSLEDDQYDMVDDASEVSTDDHDTVSLTSSAHGVSDDEVEEEQLTPEDAGSLVDSEETREVSNLNFVTPKTPSDEVPKDQAQQQTHALNKFIDSIMSEDLETPRQSTITPLQLASTKLRQECSSAAPTTASESQADGHNSLQARLGWSLAQSFAKFAKSSLTMFVLAVFLMSGFKALSLVKSPVDDVNVRRDALSTALVELTNNTDSLKIFNVEHLLPAPQNVSVDVFGRVQLGISNFHYQGAQPQYIVVSLPHLAGRYAQPVVTLVHKGDSVLDSDLTKLIEGVYALTLDQSAANGLVTVDMFYKNPSGNVTITHDFGSRIFQRKTYTNARSDVSKAINKDIAVAHQAARTLSEKLQQEIAATQNITNQVAVGVVRDLAIVRNTAVSVFSKAVAASNNTAVAVRKDIALFGQGILNAGNNVRDLFGSATGKAKSLIPTKQDVKQPLMLSRERAVMLKDKMMGREKRESKVSADSKTSKHLGPKHKWNIDIKSSKKVRKQAEKKKPAGKIQVKKTVVVDGQA